MSAVRVGIIGTGNIARAHVLGYQHAGVEIAAVCDVNERTLAKRQAQWKATAAYADYNELVNDPNVDAVSVCTPNSSHHPIVLAAAAAGKHVLCEKPVSMQLEEAQAMIDACTHAGVVFQVGHHMRSWAAAEKAKALIDSGSIGALTYARFRQAHDWGGLPDVPGVFGSLAHSGGGTLLDNGCHLFDLVRWFGGDVRDVFARVATLKFATEVEDTAIASIGYVSGAIGQVEVAWTGTGWQEAFWVYGTHGSLECDSRVGPNVLTHRYRNSNATNWSDTDVARYELRGLDSHTQHVVNFLAAMNGDLDVVCSGVDGREAVRLVLSAYRSAETNAPVTM